MLKDKYKNERRKVKTAVDIKIQAVFAVFWELIPKLEGTGNIIPSSRKPGNTVNYLNNGLEFKMNFSLGKLKVTFLMKEGAGSSRVKTDQTNDHGNTDILDKLLHEQRKLVNPSRPNFLFQRERELKYLESALQKATIEGISYVDLLELEVVEAN